MRRTIVLLALVVAVLLSLATGSASVAQAGPSALVASGARWLYDNTPLWTRVYVGYW